MLELCCLLVLPHEKQDIHEDRVFSASQISALSTGVENKNSPAGEFLFCVELIDTYDVCILGTVLNSCLRSFAAKEGFDLFFALYTRGFEVVEVESLSRVESENTMPLDNSFILVCS